MNQHVFLNKAPGLKTIHLLAGRCISRHVGQNGTIPLLRVIGGYCRQSTKNHSPEKNVITLQRMGLCGFGWRFMLLFTMI
jgi:hypothetical protein